MTAAKAWHKTPGEFWSLPSWERAYMIEYEQATDKMQQFDREEVQRKSKVKQMVNGLRQKLGLK